MLRNFLSALLVTTCVGGAPLLAAEPGGKSLDDQLLEDLDRDAPKVTPATKPKPTPSTDDKPGTAKPANALDEQLLEQFEGEDIELGPQKNPLVRIGERMRAAETLIGRKDTSKRTQELQQQIVRDLDLLLEQTKKQCQGAQCQNPSASSSSKPGSKNASSPKPGPAQEGDPGNQPAKDSTDRLGKPGENKTQEAVSMDELVKEAWGHLPEKVRRQMQNVGVEQFLPKYEKLIEAYYKRLAEEENR